MKKIVTCNTQNHINKTNDTGWEKNKINKIKTKHEINTPVKKNDTAIHDAIQQQTR